MSITLFSIFILIMSAALHEYGHGWTAYKLGDHTAKSAGRLTLNPIAHLDFFGSILLPLTLILSKSPIMIGWAKPVPYNPYNLNDAKYGELKVALGGPIMNLIIALFSGITARIISLNLANSNIIINAFFNSNYDFLLSQMNGSILSSIFIMSIITCFINLVLMIFNLIPIPPLDGSKVLMTFLPYELQIKMRAIEPYGIFIIIFLLMFNIINLIFIPIFYLFKIIIGF